MANIKHFGCSRTSSEYNYPPIFRQSLLEATVATSLSPPKLTSSSSIQVSTQHPSPHLPKKILQFPRKGRAEKVYGIYSQKQFGSKSPLLTTVIPTLKVQGLIAREVKMSGGDRWDGIVRVPELGADGQLESLESRVNAIKRKEGKYRRLTIKSVRLISSNMPH